MISGNDWDFLFGWNAAGHYLLIYNIVGGLAFLLIAGNTMINILFVVFGSQERIPQIPTWYMPAILVGSYSLYCFVHFFMIREGNALPSPYDFMVSYFDLLFGTLTAEGSPYD